MLVRFVVENVFSFGEQKEFTTIPNTSLKTLQHHLYKHADVGVLKLCSVYGANGAGKSNLIKALELMQNRVLGNKIPFNMQNSKFKFKRLEDKQEQLFAIEFIQDGDVFYYGLVMNDNRVISEELYLSGCDKREDELIYVRNTDEQLKSGLDFSADFERDEKSKILKAVLLEDFVKPNEPVLKLLSNRDNPFLRYTKQAYSWFNETLQIITPDSRPQALAQAIDINAEFNRYVKDFMCSFNLGITDLVSEKKEVKDFKGYENSKELNEIIQNMESDPQHKVGVRRTRWGEDVITKEDGKIWVKRVKIGHKGKDEEAVMFDLMEESDGTVRLLDFVPAFRSVVESEKVFVIDELERSIHPLLIKELVQKFSLDEQTKGQLIFSTHESNLLDQKIFRRDEVWFVEKNPNGATDLYSLNDFNEHKTIDIQKGYLKGRYGSIPFLGNLQDLNWHNYDTEKQTV